MENPKRLEIYIDTANKRAGRLVEVIDTIDGFVYYETIRMADGTDPARATFGKSPIKRFTDTMRIHNAEIR